MEEILKYENREQLYQFLIDDFGFIKVGEEYDAQSFGNWFVKLSVEYFFLIYVNDRSFLTIQIISKEDVSNNFDLSFVQNFIYNPDNINPRGQELDNVKRIEGLNNFIKKDFEKIKELFNSQNYNTTQQEIRRLLNEQYKRNHSQKKLP